ncbi:MAG: PfkB family carbohydrate kinase [Candidatus Dormibacteria bacterium]
MHAVGAVGRDGAGLADPLAQSGVDVSGVELLPGRSYRWRARHGPAGGAPLEERQQLGVYSRWRPSPPRSARQSEIVFLGSMPPRCQLALLEAVDGPRLVALDTMRDFILGHRRRLEAVLRRVDLLFVNRPELEALAPGGVGSLLGEGRLSAVVLKDSARGARLITPHGEWPVPAAPVAKVVDPTGAGDALAGGMLGQLARMGRLDQPALREALFEGSRWAARAISHFGPEGLLRAPLSGS